MLNDIIRSNLLIFTSDTYIKFSLQKCYAELNINYPLFVYILQEYFRYESFLIIFDENKDLTTFVSQRQSLFLCFTIFHNKVRTRYI